MSSVWDFVNSINFNKKDLMTGTENDQLAEKSYVPFIVNRSLSYFPDTILYAQTMNVNHCLSNKLQYDYLINTVRPKKRFSKWGKKQVDNNVEIVMQYYQCSVSKAEQFLTLLTPEQIKQIKEKMVQGGM